MCYGARRAPKLAVLLFFCFLGLENLQATTHKLVIKIAPKRLQNQCQNGSKTALKSILGPLGELLELSWQPQGLLEASWNALGALLRALGAEKTKLGSALGRPKGTLEIGFSDLGGQKPSQNEPRRVPNRGPKAVQAENGETTKIADSSKDFNDF